MRFRLAWRSPRKGSGVQLTLWNPVPPVGYVALGCVAVAGNVAPSVEVMCCVHRACVVAASTAPLPIWRCEQCAVRVLCCAVLCDSWCVMRRLSHGRVSSLAYSAGTQTVQAGHAAYAVGKQAAAWAVLPLQPRRASGDGPDEVRPTRSPRGCVSLGEAMHGRWHAWREELTVHTPSSGCTHQLSAAH